MITVNVAQFHGLNASDTCALWNVLSSQVLYKAARTARCFFSCTQYVYYECLIKPRSRLTEGDARLQARFRVELEQGGITTHSLTVDDLQEVALLENRKKLSKGELSTLAFASRTNQAFLTDDQKARTLARQVVHSSMVQTTPHLFGWLVYTQRLSDSDKDRVIREHEDHGRPLAQHFETIFREALRLRLIG